MRKSVLNYITFFIFSFVLIGCYERNEACLDFFATNYDLSADESCLDCCEFPDLIMQFSHRYDSTMFNVADTLIDDFDNPFVFRQFAFFISDIVLTDTDGQEHYVEDSILLNVDGIDSYFKNDFRLITTEQSSYEIGKVKIKEPLNKVSFKIGIGLSNLDLSTVDSEFVLLPFVDTLFMNGQFVPWRYQMERDTTSGIVTQINAEINDVYAIDISKELNNVVGADIRIPILIEYRKLLEGIDVSTSTDAEIITLMKNNFSKTFN